MPIQIANRAFSFFQRAQAGAGTRWVVKVVVWSTRDWIMGLKEGTIEGSTVAPP